MPQYKVCEFCGEEFLSHHGLQRYCPEKYGRKNYCKYEKKKYVNEQKMVEIVQNGTIEINQIPKVGQLEKNIEILKDLLKDNDSKLVSNIILDVKGYDVRFYTNKRKNELSKLIEILVGPYILEWIDNSGEEFFFNLKRL